MRKLEYYMYNFNVAELKRFLGLDLAELLVEWVPEGEQIYSAENLINMILAIYGNRILDNPDFRNRLYRAMEKETILDYRVYLKGYEEETDLAVVIELLGKVPWEKNDLSMSLLAYLEISDTYFDKMGDNIGAIERINAYNRFYELLDYQFLIRQKILTYINSDNDEAKMLVRMPTGTGKTKTIMHTIINQFVFKYDKKGLVIWLAHTKELLDQAYETFCNVWSHIGKDEVITYKLWDKFNVNAEEIKDGILFCGIQKLASIKKRNQVLFEKLKSASRIIVIDEAHRASATETRILINALMEHYGKSKALIGLTATPGRSKKSETEILKMMFDNKIIDIDTAILNQITMSKVDAENTTPERDIIKYFQDRGILAKLERTKLEYGELSANEIAALKIHMTENGYQDIAEDFLKLIAKNKRRNTQIINHIIDLNNEHIPTIVFACSVEHGKLLSAALTIHGVMNGHIFSKMDSVERRDIIKRFRDRNDGLNVLINYEVLTTGFDATNIGCVFITRPTNSVVLYSQMLGRGLRGPQMGGNAVCRLVDIEDNLQKYTNESEAFNYFSDYWN